MSPATGHFGAVIDTREADSLIGSLLRKTSDLREWFWDRLDPLVTDFFEAQFETEGAEGGHRWKPIAPLTRQLRARSGHGLAGSSAVLQDTLGMRRDFEHASGTGFRKVQPKEYRRGVVSEVAALQQEGWTSRSVFGQMRKAPVQVPARPIVPEDFPQSILKTWVRDYTRYLVTGS